jgi:uncharacterized protein (TIGR02145 family)
MSLPTLQGETFTKIYIFIDLKLVISKNMYSNKSNSLIFLLILVGIVLNANCCKKENVIQKNPYKGPVFNADLVYGTVEDIEGNSYKTISINTQTWMAENLKTVKFNDGTFISNITEQVSWKSLTTPGYCWNNNNPGYKNQIGAYYNWYAVNTSKLFPAGWHVPSDYEWHQMVLYLDANAIINNNPGTTLEPYESLIAGGKLKEAGNRHWS